MVIEKAIDVLKIEAEGILNLADRIDSNFTEMVNLILLSSGRLVVSGIGKSGIVGRKIVATLNSTGTRSLFLHPVEAMHGDLGTVSPDDIFLALSNSGETDELNILLPSIQNIGCKIIAFTGNKRSTLANHSDIVINVGVDREACPLGLAPTASTTALLAMGDALAVVLINKKQFKPSDFKKTHPGGTLGQRLSSNVSDIMLTGARVPYVLEGVSMEDAIEEINRLELGVTLIVTRDHILTGIITDGDLRRLIAKRKAVFEMSVDDVMTENPRTVSPESPAYDALYIMEQYEITVLPITDVEGKVHGILHLHDILGKGEFKFNGT
ncbi:MAG: KpsF/GutQ family sugar-phosphate isomerase [Deltaproteobacteria bacterium]|nr:KpsF/GutQ family sugar-phosphate isomerase [Deltaproteobacteria bacterium]MBW2192331.1 KpsF/GutQ family sugar-phosphate isomerase [Deltaproteobacteria bacterium]